MRWHRRLALGILVLALTLVLSGIVLADSIYVPLVQRRNAPGVTLGPTATLAHTSTATASATPTASATSTLTATPSLTPTLTTCVIYVKHDATGQGDGSSWADAYTDLQDALALANPGDEVWVAAGVYYPAPDSWDRAATFELRHGVAVYGGFSGLEAERELRDWEANVTVLSGDLDHDDIDSDSGVVTDAANVRGRNAYHVVTSLGSPSALLDGFVVTGGVAEGSDKDGYGGGMYSDGSRFTVGAPALANVTFSGNIARYGGGGLYNRCSPELTNVVYVGNQSQSRGGGMYNWDGNPTLADVLFTQNKAYWGGGMYINAGSPKLVSVTYHSNSAGWEGGGLWVRGSSPELSPSLNEVTFTDNEATGFAGGGIYLESGTLMVANARFISNRGHNGAALATRGDARVTGAIMSGNRAGYRGGAIADYSSDPTLVNVTVTGNHAVDAGGGVYNYNSSPALGNSIVWGNSAPTGSQFYNEGTSSPLVVFSAVQGDHPGTGNIDVDPAFVAPISADLAPTSDGDYHLTDRSPAVDTGTNSLATVDTDLDSNPRIVDGDRDGTCTVDMGAYEVQAP